MARGKTDVVNVWMMEEAEVVVDGGPAILFNTHSLGEDVELECELDGRRDKKVMEGNVVLSRVCDTARQHYSFRQARITSQKS